jgi:hypothetical protein
LELPAQVAPEEFVQRRSIPAQGRYDHVGDVVARKTNHEETVEVTCTTPCSLPCPKEADGGAMVWPVYQPLAVAALQNSALG